MRVVEQMGHGELRIVVQNGRPARIEVAIRSIKLDNPTESMEKFEGIFQL